MGELSDLYRRQVQLEIYRRQCRAKLNEAQTNIERLDGTHISNQPELDQWAAKRRAATNELTSSERDRKDLTAVIQQVQGEYQEANENLERSERALQPDSLSCCRWLLRRWNTKRHMAATRTGSGWRWRFSTNWRLNARPLNRAVPTIGGGLHPILINLWGSSAPDLQNTLPG
jgi:hypothetical protein